MNQIDHTNFYQALDFYFSEFAGKITSATEESFKSVYGSECAKKSKNIIYLFRSEKCVPRLKGESNIVYVGQTKNSFSQRYTPSAKIHSTTVANKIKYSHIIENYGPISISTCDFSKFGKSLLSAEGQILWWYFQNHCEYPPMNYTKTKIRNGVIVNV